MTLDLTIVSPVTSNVDSTICYGDSALLGGLYQTVSGSYSDTIVGGASNTCDSIVVTGLTVLTKSVGDTLPLIACDSTVWRGTTYTVSGIYTDTIQSTSGCDSVITLDLTINESYDILDTMYRCIGDSALLLGNYQTINGLYIDTLQSVNGCDSLLRTELIFSDPIYSSSNIELCYGDSAMFGGVMYDLSLIHI